MRNKNFLKLLLVMSFSGADLKPPFSTVRIIPTWSYMICKITICIYKIIVATVKSNF